MAVDEAISEEGALIVPVTLTNAEPLAGFSWTLEYDPHLLRATAVDNRGLVTEEFDVFAGGVGEPGLVKVAAVSDMDIGDGVKRLPPGQHRVAKILFEPTTKPLSRNVPLRVSNSVMAVSHNRALSHRRVDGVIKATPEVPTEFKLNQNYPNPFNPTTEITYALPVDSHVKLEIFNVIGQRVITLVDEPQEAGYKTTKWDGRDQRGEPIATGIYIYRLKAGRAVATGKALFLR